MAKTKISEYDAISANNTDVDSINIAEGCAPSGINNAIREVMAHLKDFQTGVSGDSLTVGGTLTSGTVDINGGAIDGATVGATTPSTGSFTNLTASGTVSIPDNAISGDKVEGGTINAITINTLTAGQANFADNDKAIFGDGSDLQIYHDGSHSYIQDAGTGHLRLLGNNLQILNGDNTANYIICSNGGAVDLYHNNAKKFATTSTGIDVTGTVVSDGLTVDGATDQVVVNGTSSTGSTTIFLKDSGTNGSALVHYNSTHATNSDDLWIKNYTTSGDIYIAPTNVKSALFSSNGDISFYEDTGTTAKFFWDSSAEALGIGGTPVEKLYVNSTSGDSRIGLNAPTGSDTEIKFSNNAVVEYTIGHDDGTNNFVIGTDNVDTALVSITKTGNVGIGTAAPATALDVSSSSGISTSHGGCTLELLGRGDLGYAIVGTDTNHPLLLRTNNTERLRIDSTGTVTHYGNTVLGDASTDTVTVNGYMGVGTAPQAPIGLLTNPTVLSGTTQIGFSGRVTGNSAATLKIIGNQAWARTAAEVFTVTDLAHFDAVDAIKGAGSTITNQHGLYIANQTQGTNNYGITSLVSSGTNKWNIYASGTAANYFAGNLLVGTTNQPIGTAKFVSSASGTVYGGTFVTDTAGSTPLIAWNKAASGTIYLVEFATGASYLAKGSITSNGTSTSYNTTSDYRLKEDWQPMTGASERVKALKPVNFAWKVDGSRVDGFLAHEAQAVVPEAVTGEKDAMRDEEYEVTPAVLDDDGNVVTPAVMGTRSVPDYQGIDQSKLVPLLTAALQEALAEINDLKARVSALEGN